MQPSLTNMIGILAAVANPNLDVFVDRLEGRQPSVGSQREKPCDERDGMRYREPGNPGPLFECFRDQLNLSLTPKSSQIARLRTAMADFLFQYKFSVEYPHDFDYYDYAASAQHLDTELDPLLGAFNRDVVVYLRDLQNQLAQLDKSKSLGYSENGIVTVRTIGGTDSSVTTQTQSSFNLNPEVQHGRLAVKRA